jgi:flagellar assembly protein FliH
MTSSDDEFITAESNVVTAEELAQYQRWQAPRMVSVTDVEPEPNQYLTVEDIEAMQKEAQDEGYKVGFEEGKQAGYDAGFKSGQTDITQQANYLKQVLAKLNTPLQELDQVIENDILNLVTTVVRQVIRRELKADPEHVIGAVRSAMAVLPVSDRKLKIYLNPQDIELVKKGLAMDDDGVTWQWVEDPVMARGGCRLETADTRVDATVEARIESVITKLLGGERTDDAAK